MSKAKHTVQAAQNKREETAKVNGVTDPKDKQYLVGETLHMKAVNEGRNCPGEGHVEGGDQRCSCC